jgi:hypothetical protein
MPAPKARKARAKRSEGVAGSGLLSQFHCESVVYHFTFPTEAFNRKAFSRRTGITIGNRWNAGVYPTDPKVGYHVHFRGSLEKDDVNITVEYWDGSFAKQEQNMPAAESIMEWIGSLVRATSWRSHVSADFKKPIARWRSRFNLPFKVTMADKEVVIDGVTLELPKNPSYAYHAFLMRTGTTLDASVHYSRVVDLASFNIAAELPVLNETVKIFAEESVAS